MLYNKVSMSIGMMAACIVSIILSQIDHCITLHLPQPLLEFAWVCQIMGNSGFPFYSVVIDMTWIKLISFWNVRCFTGEASSLSPSSRLVTDHNESTSWNSPQNQQSFFPNQAFPKISKTFTYWKMLLQCLQKC